MTLANKIAYGIQGNRLQVHPVVLPSKGVNANDGIMANRCGSWHRIQWNCVAACRNVHSNEVPVVKRHAH